MKLYLRLTKRPGGKGHGFDPIVTVSPTGEFGTPALRVAQAVYILPEYDEPTALVEPHGYKHYVEGF